MSAVTIVDCTLRDGSHAKSHRIGVGEVADVCAALDAAAVPVVEVSHGDGLGGSSFNYGFSQTDEFELLAKAGEVLDRARLAVLLLPGIGVKEDLRRASELGAGVVRVATHCTEADISLSHIALARELGFQVAGFLMMAHMAPAAVLAEQALIMAEAGAEIVYVTDSAGALLPGEVVERIDSLRQALPAGVAIGFHGHQNLSLAIANSLAAVESGATWIDGSTCGLGAGAGNAPTEVLAAVFERAMIETGIEPLPLMDVAEEVVKPMLDRPQVIDRAALILGYAGVYSSFLLHAERAAARFGVSSQEILVEVGRRRAVGGQEDLIIDVAAELSASAKVGVR